MSEGTHLDRAHAVMMARPDDEEARLSFYALLADTELFLLLDKPADGERIDPRLVELEGVNYVLAFDTAERLTGFAGGGAAYAGMSGRILAQMLSDAGAGLGLNLEVAPSAILLPHEAMVWMGDALSAAPEQAAPVGAIGALDGPDIPEVMLHALDAKLARAAGLAKTAYLCGREDGSMMLAILGAQEPAQAALAKAANEALVFSGLEDVTLDVAFFNDNPKLRAQLSQAGLRFDIPEPQKPEMITPGSDPEKPPKLR